jgi:hypothetical protein
MKKLWVAVASVITAPLVLATPVSAASTPKFAEPASVSVSSVTTAKAAVKFVLPSADRAAKNESVIVYSASNPSAKAAFRATVTKSAVSVTGLKPSTGYYAKISVNAANGHAASAWKVSPKFTTAKATSSGAVPYAPALSSYSTLAQSYSASDIINDGWAQDANDTDEGDSTCAVANTTYSSSLDAAVMSTTGEPSTAGSADCGHIRSQYTVPTSGDVVEAKIWLPSLSSAQTFDGSSYPAGTLTDWPTMWTNGADSTNGTENWPADTEIDAVEAMYGANYVSVHYGSLTTSGGSSGNWTTEPQGWAGSDATYATPNAGVPSVQPGWNVVDVEFTSTVANIYYNGELYVTIPASALSHDPAYLNFGISGSNGNDPNYPSWPAGPGTEDIQYVQVFT